MYEEIKQIKNKIKCHEETIAEKENIILKKNDEIGNKVCLLESQGVNCLNEK